MILKVSTKHADPSSSSTHNDCYLICYTQLLYITNQIMEPAMDAAAAVLENCLSHPECVIMGATSSAIGSIAVSSQSAFFNFRLSFGPFVEPAPHSTDWASTLFLLPPPSATLGSLLRRLLPLPLPLPSKLNAPPAFVWSTPMSASKSVRAVKDLISFFSQWNVWKLENWIYGTCNEVFDWFVRLEANNKTLCPKGGPLRKVEFYWNLYAFHFEFQIILEVTNIKEHCGALYSEEHFTGSGAFRHTNLQIIFNACWNFLNTNEL